MWIVVAVTAIAATGCVRDVPAPVVITTTSPAVQAIEHARGVLAQPVTDLAAGTLDIARRVDFIRHEVARGAAMATAITETEERATQLEHDVATLEAVLAGLDEPVLAPARDAVDALITVSREVATEVTRETAWLHPMLEVDVAMQAVVDGWDDPASRSEVAEQFGELVAEAETVRSAAHMLPTSPDGCEGQRANRIRWAERMVQRTTQLRDAAVASDGPAYDQLLADFRAQPFGEDRLAADAQSRACWARQTSLLDVGSAVEGLLAALEDALSPP